MGGEEVPIILVGNKSDDPERKVSSMEGEDKAAELCIPFAETSAKTCDGIADLVDLILDVLQDTECAGTPAFVVTLCAEAAAGDAVLLTCTGLGGDVLATRHLDQQVTFRSLRSMLAVELGVPSRAIRLLLPHG